MIVLSKTKKLGLVNNLLNNFKDELLADQLLHCSTAVDVKLSSINTEQKKVYEISEIGMTFSSPRPTIYSFVLKSKLQATKSQPCTSNPDDVALSTLIYK